jgi:hypothetical protein
MLSLGEALRGAIPGVTAWDRSARAPLPGMSAARTTSVFVQVPNPLLAGERQQALEGGAGGHVRGCHPAGHHGVPAAHRRIHGVRAGVWRVL